MKIANKIIQRELISSEFFSLLDKVLSIIIHFWLLLVFILMFHIYFASIDSIGLSWPSLVKTN